MFRWLIIAVLLSALTMSGHHRAQARLGGETVARRREGSLFLAVRALMALALFGGLLAHALWPGWMAWASFDTPQALRWLGLVLAALTLPAIHWALGALGRNVTETVLTKQHHELVTEGPYRWVRHPLYTTGLVLLLGLGLMAGSWFVLLAVVTALALLRVFVIPREEQALMAKFGGRYRTYMSRTGRLVPRVRGGSRLDSWER
jgi:protein-S-isoprenylcysteine O-methyltransferase Ste14